MNLNFNYIKIFCLLIFLFTGIVSSAQNERRITNYAHVTNIVPDKNKITVTRDQEAPKVFMLIQNNGMLAFKNDAERKSFIEYLMLDEAQKKSLSAQYKVSEQKLADKLAARAIELHGLTLVNNTNTTATIADNDSANALINTITEELTPAATETEVKNESKTSYLLPIIALILGLAIGYAIAAMKGKFSLIKKDEPITTHEKDADKSTTKKENTAHKTAQLQLDQLQQQYSTLSKDYESLYDTHQDLINFDKTYFAALDQKIISQFWDAINKKDDKKAIEFALKAVAHLTAVSRQKLEIEQSFDTNNINAILDKPLTNSNKEINAQSNRDAIPDNIHTIMNIMNKHQVTGLGNTNFQGYTMNDLSS